jgi:intracellular septation protein
VADEQPAKKNAAWVRTVVDYGAPIAFAVAYFTTKNFQTATWVLVAASAAPWSPATRSSAAWP